MATSLRFNQPEIDVKLPSCCYTLPGNATVQHGFMRSVYMGEELLLTEIVNIRQEVQAGATEVPCPVVSGGNTTITNSVLVFRNKFTFALVFATTIVNAGTVVVNYFNQDGTVYIGVIDDLELAGDKLNYTDPELLCVDGTSAVTRVDVWDENRIKLASIWQDLRGNVVPEPTGTLKAGSCDRPLDIEVLERVDNFLDTNGDATGDYVPFLQMLLCDPTGAIATGSPRLVDGTAYVTRGRVTRNPLLPPVVSGEQWLTNGQEWSSDRETQSCSYAVAYANSRGDKVLVGDTEHTTPGAECDLSVDGDGDPYLKTPIIKAIGRARAWVAWTKQKPLRDVSALLPDILDALIPVPDDLIGSDFGGDDGGDSGGDGGGDGGGGD